MRIPREEELSELGAILLAVSAGVLALDPHEQADTAVPDPGAGARPPRGRRRLGLFPGPGEHLDESIVAVERTGVVALNAAFVPLAFEDVEQENPPSGEPGLPVRGAGTVRPRPNTLDMTERARRERTERLLASRLEELGESLERAGMAGPSVERRLELASAATQRAIELRLLDGHRAAAIWADATRRHPVLAA